MAGVTREAKAARDRLPDRVSVGLLAKVFPPSLVDQVIDEAQAREVRRRALPARLMVYFTLALWLFADIGYELVLRRLVEGLDWAGWGSALGQVPKDSSITRARERLGVGVFRLLFTEVAGARGSEAMPGVFWRGLRLVTLDGTTLDVADTVDNDQRFGRPSNSDGGGSYPQVRLVALAECGTRALIGAVFGPYRSGEQTLSRALLRHMGPGMLVLADRLFPSHKLWRDATATGAALLWRVSASFTLPNLGRLADGTYLSELRPARKSDGPPIPVRVIEYSVATDGEESELFCVITNLLDPDEAPMDEVPGLYARRWEAETGLGALKTDQRGPGVVLRSKHPDGVEQELWAMLCVYQAIHHLIAQAAATGPPIDPRKISFSRAIEATRRSVGGPFSPSPAETITESAHC